ncbi:MAG TPA: DMT family transporter [Euzebyales bacterium]
MALWVIMVVAVAGGAAISLQAQTTGVISERVGTLEAVFVTYGLGGVLSALLVLVARGSDVAAVRSLPGYVWLSGVFGLVIVGTIAYSVGRLGVVRGLLLVTVAQFLVSALIDQFGWLGARVQSMTVGKAAGIVLLLVGGWLVLR